MKLFKCILMLIFIPIVMKANSNTYIETKGVDNFYVYEYTSLYNNVEEVLDKSSGPKDKKKIKKKKDVGNKTKDRRSSYFSNRYKPGKRRKSSIFDKQTFALKTNLVYSAALTPNLGVEIPIKKNFSIEATTTYNAWDMKDNVKWKNLVVMGEVRYWPKRSFEGQYFGANLHWAKYNIGGIKMPYFSDAIYYRYDGWMTGVGLSYGYMFKMSKHWSFEANIGIGLSYTSYDKYLHPVCGAYWGSYKNIIFLPTKIGLNLVYKIN